jgi:deoxyribonuclease V
VKPKIRNRWNVSVAEAKRIQLELRDRVERSDRFGDLRRVAAADVALDIEGKRALAGVVVYSFPEMEELERVWAVRPLRFPYIPGLLSFRELPVILAAFERVRQTPNLIFCDGHGYAHPRRFGIACHLGIELDRPTIGCGKSRLVGKHAEPTTERGSWTPLEDRGERIGAVLRTRTGVKPIYVSTGHRVSLESAIELVLAVCDGYRIPRPVRDADHFVGTLKREPAGRTAAAHTGTRLKHARAR